MTSAADVPVRPPIAGLYALTPDRESPDEVYLAATAALRGGAKWLQLRSKTLDASVRAGLAHRLRTLTLLHGASLVINDDAALAVECRADGVHLGRDDADLGDIARLSRMGHGDGRPLVVGVSCYDDLNLAREAEKAGAGYVAFGSFFVSGTKPLARRAPLSLLTEARRCLRVPIVAIGGIDAANATALIDAGADALALIAALFEVPDTERAARYFAALEWKRDPAWKA